MFDENELDETEVVQEEVQDPRDLKIKQLEASLNAERAERKKLKKQVNGMTAEDEDELNRMKEEYRNKLRNGKSAMSDDVIDDLMDTFGNSQIEEKFRTGKQNIEREIMELKRDEAYMDADNYADEIRSLIKRGLSAKQAYWAVAGANKYDADSKNWNDNAIKVANQNLTKQRAAQGFVNQNHSNYDQPSMYTERENAIASSLHISAEEVKARTGSLTINQILEANKKFKK